MSSAPLPLLALFDELRRAGLPLGLGEYLLLVRALRGGYGLADRAALRRLCHTLWTHSLEEQQLLDYHFDRVLSEPPRSTAADVSGEAPPPAPELPAPKPLVLGEEDDSPAPAGPAATQPAPVAADHAARVLAHLGGVGASMAVFASAGEHFPLTRRQMKQAWRHLRRTGRAGPPAELDLDATIAQIARHGMLLAPVLRPRRINRAELLLLIDRNGSMVPFHTLSQVLIDTATRGGRLGQAGVGYFHNCPASHLYHDPGQQRAEPLTSWLERLSAERTSVLIISDAGAARGGLSPERAFRTAAFLSSLKRRFAQIAWLNPMPRERWPGTTAEVIAQIVPMFAITRAGLDGAINVLRGRASRGM